MGAPATRLRRTIDSLRIAARLPRAIPRLADTTGLCRALDRLCVRAITLHDDLFFRDLHDDDLMTMIGAAKTVSFVSD